MTASPSASCSSSGIVPNDRLPSTTRVFSSPRSDELDLVAAGLRELDDAQTVRRDGPLRLATAHGVRAVRPGDVLLDRIRKRRQVAVALLDQERTVLEADEACARAFGIRRVRRRDCVVLALTRNAVDARFRNHPCEERHRGALHETALLGEPHVQRLAPEQPHYPEGSITP